MRKNFDAQRTFTLTNLETHRRLHTEAFAQRSFYTQKLLHTELFLRTSLCKAFPSITLYHKACTKYFPVLLCSTKRVRSTSYVYFALQSLHEELASTTLHYKACTRNIPVPICTTKLAQTTSQYYFVPQGLHKALPSTTLYYKACTPCTTLYYTACTKYFPVLLRTTKLAQSTSQYYFVLQCLQQVLPSPQVAQRTAQHT